MADATLSEDFLVTMITDDANNDERDDTGTGCR